MSPGTWTTQASASRPSTSRMVRSITVVGSRLELKSLVTSESRVRRSRPDSASRRAWRSCSKTWARSRAWAVSPARVERKRSSVSLGTIWATKARDSTPSGPTLPMSGSVTMVTGSFNSAMARATTSSATSPEGGSSTPSVVMVVRPRAKQLPDSEPSTGTSPRESSAGWPLLARQDSARSPGAGTRHTADWALSERRPAAMAARATSIGVVAAARAELRSCRCWLRCEAVELHQGQAGPLDRLGRGTGDGEEEVLVGGRDLPFGQPLHHHHADGAVRDDQGDDGQGVEGEWGQGRGDGRPFVGQLGHRSGEQGDIAAQHVTDGAVRIHGRQQGVMRVSARVAEAPVGLEHAPLGGGGKRGGIDAQLVAQRGEDGIGHLGRVGRRGQGPGHGLHALRGLGRHPPPPLVAGLGAGPPQLHVALRAQVRDPHGHPGAGHLGQHAQQMVELVVLARWGAEHQREEGGQRCRPGGCAAARRRRRR